MTPDHWCTFGANYLPLRTVWGKYSKRKDQPKGWSFSFEKGGTNPHKQVIPERLLMPASASEWGHKNSNANGVLRVRILHPLPKQTAHHFGGLFVLKSEERTLTNESSPSGCRCVQRRASGDIKNSNANGVSRVRILHPLPNKLPDLSTGQIRQFSYIRSKNVR